MNRVILIGRLGADPELRYTKSGAAVCTYRLATNHHTKKDGEYVEQTTWHNITVFGSQAETCERYLSKGREVCIEGRIENKDYEKDGQKRRWSEVIASRVQFLGSRGNGSQQSLGPASDAPPLEASDIPF